MAQLRTFLGKSATVFAVLAWVSLVLQLIVGGIVLIAGGPPVPIGGTEIPARIVGLLNFIAAAVYWFLFTYISKLTRLLLELHGKTTQTS